jgi:hypothetical protein
MTLLLHDVAVCPFTPWCSSSCTCPRDSAAIILCDNAMSGDVARLTAEKQLRNAAQRCGACTAPLLGDHLLSPQHQETHITPKDHSWEIAVHICAISHSSFRFIIRPLQRPTLDVCAMSSHSIESPRLCKHVHADRQEINLCNRQSINFSKLHTKSPQETSNKELGCAVAESLFSGSQKKDIAQCIRQSDSTRHSETFFVHKPLPLDIPSIRLIEVLPLGEDGEIRCTMWHVTLENPLSHEPLLSDPVAGPYACLSYVWGPPDPLCQITVNGRPFKVRTNLWKFLRTMSSLRATGTYANDCKRWYNSLWIDAICIDQGNNLERNLQVQQMGRIYSSASEVVAWLGDDATLAVLMKSATPQSVFSRNFSLKEILPGPDVPDVEQQQEYYEVLSNNAYWKRAWVVQEILLASRLFFLAPGVMMPVEIFTHTLRQEMPKPAATEIVKLLDYFAENSSNVVMSASLITNLELFRHKQCSDIRDRIYSLLSVSSDGSQLPVNYDCSIVDIIRSVIGINKRGVCFQSILFVLQAVQLDGNFSYLDACVPLIAMRGSEMLRYPATCHQCGEDISTIRHKVSASALSRSRYVCLHCNHFGTPRSSGVHEISHSGHLCVIQDKVAEENCDNWHLFWAPLEGIEWQKLQGFKYVLTYKSGGLRKLILSLGLLCELESLVSQHYNEVSVRFSNERVSQYSAGTSNWEVQDC